MFEVVLTGPRAGDPRRHTGALVGSIGIHVLLLAGILQLPVTRSVIEQLSEESVTYFSLRPWEAPAPSSASQAGAHSGRSVPAEAVINASKRQMPSVPRQLPQELPAPSATLVGTSPLSGLEVNTELVQAGAIATAYASGQPGTGSAGTPGVGGEPIDAAALAEQPRIINPRFMAQVWSELYPERLMRRGVQGQVVISFVINTDGRIDPSTVEILSATQPEFGLATLRGCKRLRFRPAKLAGQPVRVRATMPVQWTLPA